MTRFTVRKYIDKKVMSAFKAMQKGDMYIFTAPTGSGKTEAAKKYLHNKKVIIAVPTKPIGFNKMTDTIPFYYGMNPLPANRPQVCISTYDQLANATGLEDTIVVFDEAHRLATDKYRLEVFARVLTIVTKNAFGTIFMSATMEPLVWNYVFPNAKHVIVEAYDRQEHTISFYNAHYTDEYGEVTEKKSPAAICAELIKNYHKKFIPVVFVQNGKQLKILQEQFKHLNPVLLTSDEGKATYYHNNDVKHFLATGELPKECGLVLATSFAWEGYDMARHTKPYLFINGLTANVDGAHLPAIWSQMMARPRHQEKVTMIIAPAKPPQPSSLKWSPDNYSVKKLDQRVLATYNKRETNPKAFAMLWDKDESKPTVIARLMDIQESFNRVATSTILEEMAKYNLQLGGAGENDNYYLQYEHTKASTVKPKVLERLLKQPHISHRKSNGGKSTIQRLIDKDIVRTKPSAEVYALLTGFKLVQEKAYETFLAASHIHFNSWSDIDKPMTAYARIKWMREREELSIIRRVVWEHWEGKSFTQGQFLKWAKGDAFKKFYKKEESVKSYFKDLQSKQAMTRGLIGKLFKVEKTRANKNHPWKFELTPEIPLVNTAYAYEWSHRVYKIRHKKRMEEINKESEHRNRNIEKENERFTLQGCTLLKSLGIDFDEVT